MDIYSVVLLNTYYKANVSLHHSILAMSPDPFPPPQRQTEKMIWQCETKAGLGEWARWVMAHPIINYKDFKSVIT